MFKFVDLFAGIGGFHEALKQLGGECVAACEIDEYARKTYLANHNIKNDLFFKDICDVNPKDIPDHDILCAGFPCQPFSQAGFKKGFEDTRGTVFFHIARIIEVKKPHAFFLENVKYLRNHDKGNTFKTIKEVLEGFGYSFHFQIMKASDFGVPQHRPRLIMVGFKNKNTFFEFPKKMPLNIAMSDIFQKPCNKKIGFTLRVGGRGSGINDRRNWDRYLVDGKEYKIQLIDGIKMMGLPSDFKFPVSESQAMKQLGNSVAIPVIKKTAEKIIKCL